MGDRSDEVFHYNGSILTSMPARSMREGLFGKSLEDALQAFFENYPQLIPGKQIDPGNEDPPRFVLLRREMPISSWSLDHLFVDQRGILTLVETKLFENPESRREVVGQLIEYAANSIELWANGIARQKAAEYWSKKNKDLDEILQNEFGEIDIESFWASVEENLKNDRIRLIIAADEIRPEVRRMIEYLNREMVNAEILGLELKCYGEDASSVVFVPRLVGQTQSNIDRKYTGRSNINYIKWTPEKLKEAYQAYSDNILSEKLQTILNWALDNKCFKLAIALNPIFGLQGKSGDRVVSIFQDGVIYVFLNTRHYPGGPKERDEFVADLKEFNLSGLIPRSLLRNLFCC